MSLAELIQSDMFFMVEIKAFYWAENTATGGGGGGLLALDNLKGPREGMNKSAALRRSADAN